MKILICAFALCVASGVAFADGATGQYDQSIVNKMALDPGESAVNDDGVKEDPNSKMSPTARAFRNGIINGRKMQQDDEADVPPLPTDGPIVPTATKTVAEDDNAKWTHIPPQPHAAPVQPQVQQPVQPTYVQQPQYVAPPAPVASSDLDMDTQMYPDRDAAPAGNYSTSTTTRQSYKQSYSQTTTSSYATPMQQQYQPPAPPPQYVYQQPPQVYAVNPAVYAPPPVAPTQYVYVMQPGMITRPVLPTGYWPRGYAPHYAPQPRGYGRGGYGRDW